MNSCTRYVCIAVSALALSACDAAEPDGANPSAVPPTVASAAASAAASAGPAAAVAMPDVCTLFTPEEVSRLTNGKSMLSVDPDGLTPAATVRHCQWQLSGARLAVQLSPTTASTFGQDHPGAEPVPSLGDQAHFFSNHLFVRKGNIQIDVYAGTAEGVANDKQLAMAAAAIVFGRLRT